MSERKKYFGQLLQQIREAAGLSRGELAEKLQMDTSYVYRIEIGERRPSRETTLTLGEILGVDSATLEKWLLTLGYAPAPLISVARTAVRTRGGIRPSVQVEPTSVEQNTARWLESLEAMGLQTALLTHFLGAYDKARFVEKQELAKTISTAFSRIIETLESPVRKAVIPAAGGQHRILATHVMQRLLLRVIEEAAESGISNILLIMAPGTVESHYVPLSKAIGMALIPSIKLHHLEQVTPEGLGDAVLLAEEYVGSEPFAILLPDDVMYKQIGRRIYSSELRRMVHAFKQLGGKSLLAVTSIIKSKMSHCGVAEVGSEQIAPNIYRIAELLEKPDSSLAICYSSTALGIVGRYVLGPEIFSQLKELKVKGHRPLELTDALESLRRQGQEIYALELKAPRQDIGEVVEQARKIIGDEGNQL